MILRQQWPISSKLYGILVFKTLRVGRQWYNASDIKFFNNIYKMILNSKNKTKNMVSGKITRQGLIYQQCEFSPGYNHMLVF